MAQPLSPSQCTDICKWWEINLEPTPRGSGEGREGEGSRCLWRVVPGSPARGWKGLLWLRLLSPLPILSLEGSWCGDLSSSREWTQRRRMQIQFYLSCTGFTPNQSSSEQVLAGGWSITVKDHKEEKGHWVPCHEGDSIAKARQRWRLGASLRSGLSADLWWTDARVVARHPTVTRWPPQWKLFDSKC